eukprot:47709-Amphidinium_carterae.1
MLSQFVVSFQIDSVLLAFLILQHQNSELKVAFHGLTAILPRHAVDDDDVNHYLRLDRSDDDDDDDDD